MHKTSEENKQKQNTQLQNIFCKLLISSPKAFFIKVFNTLHPTKKYQDNWHIDLMLEYLKTIEEGKIKRLIINIPPRTLKSVCINVFWPTWLLAKNPAMKIITVSYSQELSNKHSQDCRFVMQQDWFKRYFPESLIIKGRNTKSKFMTAQHGFRFATSVGGTLTGEGADIIIVDDPQTPLQALSKKERAKTITWFEQTLMSRLNNKQNGIVVLIMQRLHVDDLAGYLLKKRGWKLLKIPIIAEKDEEIKFKSFKYDRKYGEVLNVKYDNKKIINKLKDELGNYAFNAQYQQNPQSIESEIIKSSWIQYYKEGDIDHINTNTENDMLIYQSWDCAIKDKNNNDYTVCITLGVHNNKYYLLDVFREKLAYPYLKEKIISLYNQFKPVTILIEDKASGQQLIQELEHLPIIGILPKYNKLTRLILVTPLLESKSFYIPHTSSYASCASWVKDFYDELITFPYVNHDDQVDALTQVLYWLIAKNKISHVMPNVSRL